MKIRSLTETPIADFEVDKNFDKGTNYQKHDKKLITDPKSVKKMIDVFKKVPVDINFYFFDSPSLKHLQAGFVTAAHVGRSFGLDVEQWVRDVSRKDNITVIHTNNASNTPAIPMTPWMLGHRFAHSLMGDSAGPMEKFDTTVDDEFQKAVKVAYKREYGEWGWKSFLKEFGAHVGTMQSARKNMLVTKYEFTYELFTQYLVTGKITLNPLPEKIDKLEIEMLPTSKPRAEALWAKIPEILEKAARKTLEAAKGQIILM